MSETSSLRTNCSRSRYRTLSRKCSVDESLFGRRRGCRNNKRSAVNRKEPTNVCGNHEESSGSMVCLKSSDLARMMNRIHSDNNQGFEQSTHCLQNNEEVSVKAKRARERKERMRLIDEQRNKKAMSMTQSDKISARKADLIRSHAEAKMDENEDIVKLLNTYSQRAVAFHIRDQQLKDKAERLEKERDYEKRMDLAMEIDRLKDIESRKNQELDKLEKRIEDRKVIEMQMEERRQMKLLREEERQQENQRMIEAQKRYERQCIEDELKQREQAAKSRQEVILANEAALEARKQLKLREIEETEQILAYQTMMDEKLRKREEEEAEIARQKVEIQKKMLESQSKTLDNKHELDELRMRRAFEEAERRCRQKDLMEARKRKEELRMLNEARQQQETEQREMKKRDKLVRQQEYEAALSAAAEMAHREEQEALQRERTNSQFRQDIRTQIEERDMLRKNDMVKRQQEGQTIKDEIATERIKLENIRNQMVQDLRKIGVKQKYFSEMLALDIEKFHMR